MHGHAASARGGSLREGDCRTLAGHCVPGVLEAMR